MCLSHQTPAGAMASSEARCRRWADSEAPGVDWGCHWSARRGAWTYSSIQKHAPGDNRHQATCHEVQAQETQHKFLTTTLTRSWDKFMENSALFLCLWQRQSYGFIMSDVQSLMMLLHSTSAASDYVIYILGCWRWKEISYLSFAMHAFQCSWRVWQDKCNECH